MKIFDTHCHPYLNKEKEQNEVIKNFFENGGEYMLIIGTNLETSKKSINIANKYSGIYTTIGIHPCDIEKLDLQKTIKKLEELYLKNKDKIVGIGECGLDYYRIERDKEINTLSGEFKLKAINLKKDLQAIFFKAQLLLAKKYNLPVIIHNRESKEDILKILKELDFKNFIFHCYSEDLEYANKLISFSQECKLSFSGIVTFKSAKDIQETAKKIPEGYILAETDSPYLTPTPFRGKQENEPLFTKYVIDYISDLRGKDMTDIIFDNSLKFLLKDRV